MVPLGERATLTTFLPSETEGNRLSPPMQCRRQERGNYHIVMSGHPSDIKNGPSRGLWPIHLK